MINIHNYTILVEVGGEAVKGQLAQLWTGGLNTCGLISKNTELEISY